ncbi:MAG TPA: dipeptidase [Pyrinomonadaceae bacterium]|jgi:membrane dipeptidase|nr:dipeptidase [Pyrinomonadaceae bacterium]
MPPALALVALAVTLALEGCRMSQNSDAPTQPVAASQVKAHDDDPRSMHARAILIDMHADTVQRMIDEGADINTRLTDGHLDAPRMKEGGLDAQFFSIWVEPQYFGVGGKSAVERADKQIAAVRALADEHPETWELATSASDIRRIAAAGRLAALMGLEGGYAIDERLENVEKYYRLGVRYMSPAWSVSLSWAGSSGDALGQTRGLNEFGRAVIGEMNRLGIMVDVSHVSDQTFWDIIETSKKPVIATHSGVRSIVNVPRNLTDDQLLALARTGGLCAVVFYPRFIEPGWQEAQRKVDAEIAPLVAEASRAATGTPAQKKLARDRVREREYAKRLPPVSVARVVDHIDHIVKLVGVDHVGIGSDFDGIQSVPHDLSTVADFPNLTAELLKRGYSESDIHKILGGNMLRVMEEVERTTGGQAGSTGK